MIGSSGTRDTESGLMIETIGQEKISYVPELSLELFEITFEGNAVAGGRRRRGGGEGVGVVLGGGPVVQTTGVWQTR